MKKLLTIALIILLLHSVQVFAFQPIFPPPNDYNMKNIKSNFDNILTYRRTISSGSNVGIFTDVSCDVTSVVIATLNTQTGQYIVSAVPTASNTITVYLNDVASTDLTISLFTILNN